MTASSLPPDVKAEVSRLNRRVLDLERALRAKPDRKYLCDLDDVASEVVPPRAILRYNRIRGLWVSVVSHVSYVFTFGNADDPVALKASCGVPVADYDVSFDSVDVVLVTPGSTDTEIDLRKDGSAFHTVTVPATEDHVTEGAGPEVFEGDFNHYLGVEVTLAGTGAEGITVTVHGHLTQN